MTVVDSPLHPDQLRTHIPPNCRRSTLVEDLHQQLRALIGLHGPAVSVTVAAREVALMARLADDAARFGQRQSSVDNLVRELDHRLGAAKALDPGAIAYYIPFTPTDQRILRSAFDSITGRMERHRYESLMREIDERIGAAQVAAARASQGQWVPVPRQGLPSADPREAIDPDGGRRSGWRRWRRG